jgi:(p)ppGpp synthase/HD superfamily hydrolase
MTNKPDERIPNPVINHSDAARLGAALAFAAECHGRQARKGTDIPYLSHLLHVAALTLEQHGSVNQAIAGLLHDVVEDCEGVTFEEIERRCGGEVTSLVRSCTDTLSGGSPRNEKNWKERKLKYLDHIAEASRAAVLVSACDKCHNLGSLVADVRRHGVGYLARFNAKPELQVWFYRKFFDAVKNRVPKALAVELGSLVDQFALLVGGECPDPKRAGDSACDSGARTNSRFVR